MKISDLFKSRKATEEKKVVTKTTEQNDNKINTDIFTDTNLKQGFTVYSPETILASPQISELVDKVSIAFGSKRELFNNYLMPSIKQVALYMQKLPGAESVMGDYISPFGHHGGVGGL